MTMQQAMVGLRNAELLTDGLYVGRDDHGGVWFKAEREGMIHQVYLEAGGFRLLQDYFRRTQRSEPAPLQPPVSEEETHTEDETLTEDPGYADGNDND